MITRTVIRRIGHDPGMNMKIGTHIDHTQADYRRYSPIMYGLDPSTVHDACGRTGDFVRVVFGSHVVVVGRLAEYTDRAWWFLLAAMEVNE